MHEGSTTGSARSCLSHPNLSMAVRVDALFPPTCAGMRGLRNVTASGRPSPSATNAVKPTRTAVGRHTVRTIPIEDLCLKAMARWARGEGSISENVRSPNSEMTVSLALRNVLRYISSNWNTGCYLNVVPRTDRESRRREAGRRFVDTYLACLHCWTGAEVSTGQPNDPLFQLFRPGLQATTRDQIQLVPNPRRRRRGTDCASAPGPRSIPTCLSVWRARVHTAARLCTYTTTSLHCPYTLRRGTPGSRSMRPGSEGVRKRIGRPLGPEDQCALPL